MINRDKSIPDSIAIKKIKPLARQRGRLTKRIRQIGSLSSNSGDVSEEEVGEEGDLVKGPLDHVETFDQECFSRYEDTKGQRRSFTVYVRCQKKVTRC